MLFEKWQFFNYFLRVLPLIYLKNNVRLENTRTGILITAPISTCAWQYLLIRNYYPICKAAVVLKSSVKQRIHMKCCHINQFIVQTSLYWWMFITYTISCTSKTDVNFEKVGEIAEKIVACRVFQLLSSRVSIKKMFDSQRDQSDWTTKLFHTKYK